MSYCIECGTEAEVCFCEYKKVVLDEYQQALKECKELKCYCKKHNPEIWNER